MKIVYDLTPSLDRQLLFSHHFSNSASLWLRTCMLYEYGSKPFSADLHLKFLCSPCSLSSFYVYMSRILFPFGISIEITLTWIYILRHSKSDILKYEQKDGIREKYSFDVEFKGHMHLINFRCSQTKMFRKKEHDSSNELNSWLLVHLSNSIIIRFSFYVKNEEKIQPNWNTSPSL